MKDYEVSEEENVRLKRREKKSIQKLKKDLLEKIKPKTNKTDEQVEKLAEVFFQKIFYTQQNTSLQQKMANDIEKQMDKMKKQNELIVDVMQMQCKLLQAQAIEITPNSSYNSNRDNRLTKVCYNCGKSGHYALCICKAPKKPSPIAVLQQQMQQVLETLKIQNTQGKGQGN